MLTTWVVKQKRLALVEEQIKRLEREALQRYNHLVRFLRLVDDNRTRHNFVHPDNETRATELRVEVWAFCDELVRLYPLREELRKQQRLLNITLAILTQQKSGRRGGVRLVLRPDEPRLARVQRIA